MLKVRFVAASLVAALMASPVILDACLFMCHGSTATDAGRSEPSCHHSPDDADLRLEAPAAACGHDHSPSPSTMTGRPLGGADSRCEVDLAICDAPVLEGVRKRASFTTASIASPPGGHSRASTPLRI